MGSSSSSPSSCTDGKKLIKTIAKFPPIPAKRKPIKDFPVFNFIIFFQVTNPNDHPDICFIRNEKLSVYYP